MNSERNKNLFAASKACGKIGKTAFCVGAGFTLIGWVCAVIIDHNNKKQINNKQR